MTLPARLYAAITAAGVPIVSVTPADYTNKATWTVQPPNLQAAAQPIIDAFDPNNPALAIAEADAQVQAALMTPEMRALVEWVAEALQLSPTVAHAGVRRHMRRINRSSKET